MDLFPASGVRGGEVFNDLGNVIEQNLRKIKCHPAV
jgi:hypothetical protein